MLFGHEQCNTGFEGVSDPDQPKTTQAETPSPKDREKIEEIKKAAADIATEQTEQEARMVQLVVIIDKKKEIFPTAEVFKVELNGVTYWGATKALAKQNAKKRDWHFVEQAGKASVETGGAIMAGTSISNDLYERMLEQSSSPGKREVKKEGRKRRQKKIACFLV